MSNDGTSLDDFLNELDSEVEEPSLDPTPLPEEDAPAESGQADPEGTPSAEILDLAEYGNRLVVVKRNGEDVQLPLNEAIADGLRQSDYTRKTQEVATARALQAALQNNPAATLKLLAETYGVDFAQQVADTQVPTPDEPDWTENDPALQRLAQFESRFAEFERYQQEQVLDRTLAGLQEKYGDDFDANEVIAAAVERQISGPHELESVYRDLMFDKFYAQAKARDDFSAQRSAEDAQREAAKAGLAKQVEQGSSVPNGSVSSTPASFDSIFDAWNAAKAELGISSL
jgi:hypothetical protein